MMRPVHIAGTGMTKFGKQPESSLKSLAIEAVHGALTDASVSVNDVDLVFFANAVAGSITGQEMIPGQVALGATGLLGRPIYNVENACASASSALQLACMAVASGHAEIALAVGVEKMTHPDKRRALAAIGGALDVELATESGNSDRSPFMDHYAQLAKGYFARTDATPRDLAEVAVKNQHNGSLNPLAQYGASLSVDDVLTARSIVDPLTLLMCAPISDGAAAALVVSEGVAAKLGVIAPRVAACVLTSGVADPEVRGSSTERAAAAAYEMAGIGPDEIDLAEVHDAAAPAELLIYEELGLVPKGDGAKFIRSGGAALGGSTPINTSGGLLARGHPIGATGLGQIHELVLQLRGAAGPRQVTGASRALAHNSGGWLGADNAGTVVTVLTN